MAVISAVTVPKTGLVFTTTLTNTPAAGGDRVPAGCVLVFRNTNAGALTVTLNTVDTIDGDLVVADRAQTAIPATTGTGIINVPLTYPYVDPTDGNVLVTTSVQSGVTFACINP